MSPRHHPSDDTLLAYAAGTLGAGPRLVVSIHLAGCPHCREVVRGFEAVGGALLEAAAPVALAPDALARLFEAIDAEEASALAPAACVPPAPAPRTPDGLRLPEALSGHSVGPWRRIPGRIAWARVAVAGDRRANVVLLRMPAGRAVPRHGHQGAEFTQILVGGFSDEHGSYGPGDMVEADADLEHLQRVDDDGECLCIAAVEGRLKLGGLARLLGPIMGL